MVEIVRIKGRLLSIVYTSCIIRVPLSFFLITLFVICWRFALPIKVTLVVMIATLLIFSSVFRFWYMSYPCTFLRFCPGSVMHTTAGWLWNRMAFFRSLLRFLQFQYLIDISWYSSGNFCLTPLRFNGPLGFLTDIDIFLFSFFLWRLAALICFDLSNFFGAACLDCQLFQNTLMSYSNSSSGYQY